MLLYRYIKRESIPSIEYVESPFEESDEIKKDKPEVIISAAPHMVTEDGRKYVYDIETGRFYVYSKTTFEIEVSAEAILAPQCKAGLRLYDKNVDSRKEIGHIGRNGHVYLPFKFNTDRNGVIWAKVFTLDDSYRHVEQEGYIIYKNSRHNFANVEFTDSTQRTVLTDGKIDEEKIRRVSSGETIRIPVKTRARARAASSYDSSTKNDVPKPIDPGSTIIDIAEYIANVSLQAGGVSLSTSKRIWPCNVTDLNKTYFHDLSTNGPSVVSNLSGFPRPIRFIRSGETNGETEGMWEYDYTLNYEKGLGDLTQLYKDYNLDVRSIYDNTKHNLELYNRFKFAFPDDILSKGYMHVFMTRPDVNYYDVAGDNLRSEVGGDPFLKYMAGKKPQIVKQLVEANGDNHQFMMLLSNKARGFSLTDDGINHDTYGKSRSGYSIAYGRRRDSELGGSLNIAYKDTRDFDILNLHKLWVDYIVNVFSGKWTPKSTYIRNKIIDYATAVYVIVTAEDFETVLFWTKYYGVFPVSLPFSAISWESGSTLSSPELSVTYAYSWKEDLNPIALAELNMNSFKLGIPQQAKYTPTFNPEIAAVNRTWVGAPFIEIIRHSKEKPDLTNGANTTIKLRFQTP